LSDFVEIDDKLIVEIELNWLYKFIRYEAYGFKSRFRIMGYNF